MIAVHKTNAFSRTRRSLFGQKTPRFADQYEVGRLIKAGGSGSVYLAIHKETQEKFAVKVIDRTQLSKRAEKEILREVDIMRELQQAQVQGATQVKDFFVSRKHYRIVLPLARGGDLQDHVIRHGAFRETDARVVAIKLLQTVQAFHNQGIVHRDLKLPNILLEDADDNTSILVADWGFADRYNDKPLTKACGTPTWIAPEVLVDSPAYNQAVDLWGVGCIVYSLLSGHPPFKLHKNDYELLFAQIRKGEFQSMDHKWWTGVSEEAKDFLRGLLEVDPNKRWTPAEALRSAWITRAASESRLLLDQ